MQLSLPGWAPQQSSASFLETTILANSFYLQAYQAASQTLFVPHRPFDIPGDFSVLYQDMDFNGQFFTLTSIGDVEDKATLKVVPVKPVVLTLSSVEEIEFDSPPPRESSDTISTHSSSSDTIILSSPDESGTSRRSQPWPARFKISTFSFDIEQHLQAGNQAFLKDGALLNHPSLTSSILEKLAEVVFGYTA